MVQTSSDGDKNETPLAKDTKKFFNTFIPILLAIVGLLFFLYVKYYLLEQ